MLLHHPSFADVIQDVPDADAPEWLAAGWLQEPPVPATPPADSVPAAAPATIESNTLTGDEQGVPDNSEVPAESQE